MLANTKARQAQLTALAALLVDREAIAQASHRLAKAMRTDAQAKLMEQTGCDLKTARKHIKQAIGEQ